MKPSGRAHEEEPWSGLRESSSFPSSHSTGSKSIKSTFCLRAASTMTAGSARHRGRSFPERKAVRARPSARPPYDRQTRSVNVSRRDGPTEPVGFHLDADRDELELWLSEYFETRVSIVETAPPVFPTTPWPRVRPSSRRRRSERSHPGSRKCRLTRPDAAFVPTSSSKQTNTSTLGRPARGTAQVHRFGRTGCLCAPEDVVRFRVGEVCFEGTEPVCPLCGADARFVSGQTNPEFHAIFRHQRAATLPAWTHRRRFDHFYRLAVNTRPVLPLSARLSAPGISSSPPPLS